MYLQLKTQRGKQKKKKKRSPEIVRRQLRKTKVKGTQALQMCERRKKEKRRTKEMANCNIIMIIIMIGRTLFARLLAHSLAHSTNTILYVSVLYTIANSDSGYIQ